MSQHKSQDGMLSPEGGGINELDEILKNLELENKHETQLLEKEQQQILALEMTLKEKQEGIRQMHEALDKSDEDAKALHKQFRQNKENVESLRKHADVLSCHGDTLETKLQQLREKHEMARNDRATKFAHYQSIWTDYQEKYESSPLAEKWKSCHQEAELGLRDLMEQADAVKELKEAIKAAETKLKSASERKDSWKAWIIDIAKTKVSSSKILQEAELTEKRITEIKKQVDVAREKLKKQQEEEEAATKANQMRIDNDQQNRPSGGGDAPASAPSSLRFPEKPVQPELVTKSSRRFQIPRLIIPQSPRLQNQSGPPRDVPPPTPPPPGMFLEVPQRINTAMARPPPPPKNLPATSKKYLTPLKDSPRNDCQLPVMPESGREESSPSSLDERQDEGRDTEIDEAAPMETDADQTQGCDMESSSSQPATPGDAFVDHGGSDYAATEGELSASQVREKIRSLPQSPGFQFACRPMYSEQDIESFSLTPPASKGAPNASEAFLSSFFGQAGSSSAVTPADGSVLNMFGSPVAAESSEDNIMSLFGPSSPREASDPVSQEAASGFSFNFAPSSSSPTAESERSSFSLF